MTGGSGKSGDPRRAERLKAALRDNLKRRKAQAKARAQAAAKAAIKAGRARFRRNYPRNCAAQAERLVTLQAAWPCGMADAVLSYRPAEGAASGASWIGFASSAVSASTARSRYRAPRTPRCR